MNGNQELLMNSIRENSYLSWYKTVERLIKEKQEHGKLIIAFDFDNTIYDFHNAGLETETVRALLVEAHAQGHELYCFTANSDEDLVRAKVSEYLDIDDIAINESSLDHLFGTRKPFYNLLLDDRAGLFGACQALAVVLDN
jgi:predicted HAD superfamily phosphohydrolase YqeG